MPVPIPIDSPNLMPNRSMEPHPKYIATDQIETIYVAKRYHKWIDPAIIAPIPSFLRTSTLGC